MDWQMSRGIVRGIFRGSVEPKFNCATSTQVVDRFGTVGYPLETVWGIEWDRFRDNGAMIVQPGIK